MASANYLEEKVLAHVLGITTFPSPTLDGQKLYLALGTEPVPNEGGTWPGEIWGKGYCRAAVRGFRRSNHNGTYCEVENVGGFRFSAATEEWGSVNYWALFDAPAAGNMFFFGQFSTGQFISAGDWFSVRTGDFTFFIDPFPVGPVQNVLAYKLLGHIFLGEAFAVPTPLMTLAPTPDGGYAPVSCSGISSAPAQDEFNRAVSNNTSAITFPEATADWGNSLTAVLQDGAGNQILSFGVGGIHQEDQGFFEAGALTVAVQ